MSGKLSSPRDLFLQLLSQMLWTERMLAFDVLPGLQKQAQSESLAGAFEEHLAQTHEHVARVEAAFHALGVEAASARSAPAAALADEHQELTSKIAEPRLADVFHAAAAIETEHLELAGYAVLIELAHTLDRDDVASELGQNRADEKEALDRLCGLLEQLRAQLPA
jgi:ferritin-like metal-binding protein YciE